MKTEVGDAGVELEEREIAGAWLASWQETASIFAGMMVDPVDCDLRFRVQRDVTARILVRRACLVRKPERGEIRAGNPEFLVHLRGARLIMPLLKDNLDRQGRVDALSVRPGALSTQPGCAPAKLFALVVRTRARGPLCQRAWQHSGEEHRPHHD